MAQQDRPNVVMITGASAGVGRAAAREFAKHGAMIGLIARGRAGLEGAERDVASLGGKGLVIPADVSDPDQVEAAASKLEQAFGPIDIWVNNAMCSVFSPAKKMEASDYRRVTEVTYLGTVYGTLAALRRMLPRNRGMIVQVGSALAYRGIPLQSAYCGGKHAIQGFTESVRCELIHDNSDVKITMVQMPALNTPQFDWVKNRLGQKPQPVPPVYQPEVAAQAIYHAAHHYRREWLVGGSTAMVVQANKILPGLGDWYLGQQGYSSQQTDRAQGPEHPDNLDQPVDDAEDFGAHGDFDDQSKKQSLQVWVDQHRWTLMSAAIAGGACGLLRGPWRHAARGVLIGGSLAATGILSVAALSQRLFSASRQATIDNRLDAAAPFEHVRIGEVSDPVDSSTAR